MNHKEIPGLSTHKEMTVDGTPLIIFSFLKRIHTKQEIVKLQQEDRCLLPTSESIQGDISVCNRVK